MNTKYLLTLFAAAAAFILLSLTSCIEDEVSTSPADQPVFSTDTLRLGQYFTGEPTPTQRFLVYNRHAKVMNISRIAFADADQRVFRINVDGQSGSTFSNIEIRPNDSIFVMVESTLPVNGSWGTTAVSSRLDFETNGVRSSVVITAKGEDIERLRGATVAEDTRWEGDHPRQILDSLVVAEGATLTLGPGVRLYFHDKSFLRVDGTLRSEGTPSAPVDLGGDRRGDVISGVSFDLMDSQWEGVLFSPTSRDNRLDCTTIRNTLSGVVVDTAAAPAPSLSRPVLTLRNCRLRNSAGYALAAFGSSVDAVGCEIADAANGVLYLDGGDHSFVNCTFANYYLFSALRGPAITLSTLRDSGEAEPLLAPMRARFVNSIVYGNGADLSEADLAGTEVVFDHCLLKSAGSDDDNFVATLWDTDPMYYTERSEYIFDYRLRPESPAIAASDPATFPGGEDFYGTPRKPGGALGAYEFAE
ncbi:MAG: hypothetical protein NC336_03415 [Clostridium sp.]|nr:hypothetical protein [Clostridium sp.]